MGERFRFLFPLWAAEKGGVEKSGQNIFIVRCRVKWAADVAAHLSPPGLESVRTDFPIQLPAQKLSSWSGASKFNQVITSAKRTQLRLILKNWYSFSPPQKIKTLHNYLSATKANCRHGFVGSLVEAWPTNKALIGKAKCDRHSQTNSDTTIVSQYNKWKILNAIIAKWWSPEMWNILNKSNLTCS